MPLTVPAFELVDAAEVTEAEPNPYAEPIASLAQTFDAEAGRTSKALTGIVPAADLSKIKRKISAAANALGYSPRITTSAADKAEDGTAQVGIAVRLTARIERTGRTEPAAPAPTATEPADA